MTATPVQNQPTMFELSGQNIRVTYSTTSIAGRPQFHFRDLKNHLDHTFSGDLIRVLETEIGQMVTVTVPSPMAEKRTLTLLIPIIKLQGGEVQFQTQAIFTSTLVGASGEGPQQSYRSLRLKGKARRVAFV